MHGWGPKTSEVVVKRLCRGWRKMRHYVCEDGPCHHHPSLQYIYMHTHQTAGINTRHSCTHTKLSQAHSKNSQVQGGSPPPYHYPLTNRQWTEEGGRRIIDHPLAK